MAGLLVGCELAAKLTAVSAGAQLACYLAARSTPSWLRVASCLQNE